jgi:hypothetical protein
MGRREGTTNRNGLVGEYAEFAPRRRTMAEFIEMTRSRAGGSPLPVERQSRNVGERDGYVLVRYRLGSDELTRDLDAVGGAGFSTSDYPDMAAFFGILDEAGKPQVVLNVIDDGGLAISFVFAAEDAAVPSEVVHDFLDRLDVPAAWNAGADNDLANRFDLRWDDATGWVRQEPRHLVKVEFERVCFGTRPVLREAVDVFLMPDPAYDMADPNDERAYWAKDFYRETAWGEFHRLPQSEGVRPGFSSWMTKGEPHLVKVLDQCLDQDIARLSADRSPKDDGMARPIA